MTFLQAICFRDKLVGCRLQLGQPWPPKWSLFSTTLQAISFRGHHGEVVGCKLQLGQYMLTAAQVDDAGAAELTLVDLGSITLKVRYSLCGTDGAVQSVRYRRHGTACAVRLV